MGHTIRSLIHFNFYIWWKIRVGLLSFACEYAVFPSAFVEETVLFPLSGFGTLVEGYLAVYVSSCLASLFSSVGMFVFIPVPLTVSITVAL